MATWEVWLDDPQGNRIKVLDEIINFDLALTVNKPAPCILSLPETFDDSLLKTDGILEFWRRPANGELRLFNIYFIRGNGAVDDQSARETVVVKGWDAKYLLGNPQGEGRIVAYDADDAMSELDDYADDGLKRIFSENLLGDATDTS